MTDIRTLERKANDVVQIDEEVETLIDDEREMKMRVLREVIRVSKPALDALSSVVVRRVADGQRFNEEPARRGVLVDEVITGVVDGQTAANRLFISPDGEVFGARVKGVFASGAWQSWTAVYADLSVEEVVAARWPMNRILLNLVKAMDGQYDGLSKKAPKIMKTVQIVSAVAALLENVK